MRKFEKILDIILPIIIGVELIILVIGNNSVDSIFFSIKEILLVPLNWFIIFLSMLIGYIGEALRGIRWKLLIEPMNFKVKTIDLVNACAAGYMFNAGVPRSGEIARCSLINRVAKTPISYLFGHVLVERVIDFIILFFCIIVCLIYKWNVFITLISNSNYFSWILTTNTLVVAILIIGVILFLFSLKEKFITFKSFEWLKKYLFKIREGVYAIFSVKEKKLFALYTILIWLCYLLMTYVCFWCFQSMQNFNLLDGLLIMTIGGIGMVIPTPGGMGSYHGAVYIGLFFMLGQEASVATTFGFLVHTAQTIMIVVMGFIGLLFLNLRKPYNSRLK